MSASKTVRSRKDRHCDHCGRFHIKAGDLYERTTMFPSDEFFSWLDRDTLRPLRSPVVLVRCIEQGDGNE